MAFCNRNGEKRRIVHDFRRQDEEVVRSLCRMGSRPISPRSIQEQEKRIRREIANSNERRRMQSINAGFQYLRTLLPQGESEKLSKAAILQHTADYIYSLEQEKTALLEQNSHLKRTVMNSSNNHDSDGGSSDSPFPKRKKVDTGELSDEGIGIPSPGGHDYNIEDMRREISDLKNALDIERRLRFHLQDKMKQLESQSTVPFKSYEAALQDHISYYITENSNNQKIFEESPKPHILNERDNFHEVPVSHEVPEDLSGKNINSQLYSSTTEASNVIAIQSLPPTPPPPQPPAFTVELEIASPNEASYIRPRPNLTTIFEAIKHLEGDHLFRDDPVSPKSPVNQQWNASNNNNSIDEANEKIKSETETCQQQSLETTTITTNEAFALQHQIIRNAPVSQSRPGVIVSKLS